MVKKITLFDHVHKFTGDLIQHWQNSGYEFKQDRYFDPRMTLWADTSFFEFCDNSLMRASHADDSLWADCPQPHDKNIICRLHDLDAWAGNYNGVVWEWVNHLVFVCDHIRDMVLKNGQFPASLNIHTIPHGINLDKFTYTEHGKGNKIAWIGNLCHHKCLELALQVLLDNPSHELHVVGDSLRTWERFYVETFVARNNLHFHFYEHGIDINEFLEDKDYLLLTSFKEAFSFVTGEAMAKGIKPIIHHFPGAEKIWPEKYLWNSISEVKRMLTEYEYNSREYRDFIEATYPLDKMLKAYDQII